MKLLYHASNNLGLDVLEPQNTLSKDKHIGKFVFATADKLLAAMYLVPKGFGIIMDPKSSPPKLLICAEETEIKAKDKGGAIYAVDAADFTDSPQQELSEYEKVSTKSVRTISKEIFDSVFDAWNHMGIKVEFIDQPTFERLSRI